VYARWVQARRARAYGRACKGETGVWWAP
jgi:hypothetical protein